MGTQNQTHFDKIRSWTDIAEWCATQKTDNWTLLNEFQIRARGFRTIAQSIGLESILNVNINVSMEVYPGGKGKYISVKLSAREPLLKNEPLFGWIMARLMPKAVMDWWMDGTDIVHIVRTEHCTSPQIYSAIVTGLKGMEKMLELKNEAEEKLFQSFG